MANILDVIKKAGSGLSSWTASRLGTHVGKWGTPELKITELLTPHRTGERGSDIIPNVGLSDVGTPRERVTVYDPVQKKVVETSKITPTPNLNNLTQEQIKQLSKNISTTQYGGKTDQGLSLSGVNISQEYLPSQLARMTGLPESEMWSGKEVVINNQKFRIEDTGKGTRRLSPVVSGGGGGGSNQGNPPSPQQIVNEVLDKAKRTGTEGLLDENTIKKILDDVYDRGMSVADAMERRQREAAEERWRLIQENLQRQKGEISAEAARQRQLAKEQEALYKGQIEKRKQSELETITGQREGAEKEVLQMKDELGRAFQDTSRKLQAILRASGVAQSGFAVGEEARLLRDFNRNLDVIAIKHKETLDELDKAYRDTISVYNDKIENLEFETRKAISDINAWERQQIVAIQNNENLNLADKLDRIADAINRADMVRMQVEQNYANQKLAWAQWMQEMQVKMALSAQYAAQNRINSAQKTLQLIRQQYQDAINNVAFAKWKQTPEGKWVLESPTYSGYIPIGIYSDEEKERIEKKKMEAQPSILDQVRDLERLNLGGGSW